ncbi:hypothetical protein A5724_26175 [Mycobacterium sp. ACS1612]|uniref:hypothetical protein n=1 Tax=Mycobacterium sp. ACS1612 TaxID=1834117 RepID=UPI000800111B|nr:hypothetical protein [Mycobacterium sp. ACS1612]OBF28908.1 hypothetical protein A5724_26175 [Mycobacterium sp. ACS1612]
MVYPQYPDNQPEIVPWPSDYDDPDINRGKRSPVLAASVAGVVAVLVLAVGVVLGLQLSRPDPLPPVLPSAAPSPNASGPSAATTVREPASRQAERNRAREAERLDRSTYTPLTAREFAMMAKNPDSWAGRKIVVYGVITQFDAATGATAFRADTGPSPTTDPYDYDQNTLITAHDARMVANFVEDDVVTMFAEVQGAVTYDTQIGGKTTVPSLLANIVETTKISSPPRTLTPTPVTLPASDIVGAQLRAVAAGDQPAVVNAVADRWVPQLSSKRVGMVAEGATWTNEMILADHQQLRARYPDVRLLWSGSWSTFSESDFWVTIVGAGFPTADQALAWCTSNGLDRDHCYAKLISTTHAVEGSTAYNK